MEVVRDKKTTLRGCVNFSLMYEELHHQIIYNKFIISDFI